MKEVWKPLKGIVVNGDNYEVSNLGHVRNRKTGRILSTFTKSKGYVTVGLSFKGKVKPYKVHRLVALTFISNPNEKPDVNHKDACKSNNCVSNLEWATRLENMTHAKQSGLMVGAQGSRARAAKLSEVDVLSIKRQLMQGVSHSQLAVEFKVTNAAIGKIHQGVNWSHVEVDGFKPIINSSVGTNNRSAVLNEKEVREIRKLFSIEKLSAPKLAKMYGITKQAVYALVNYKTWKHVD